MIGQEARGVPEVRDAERPSVGTRSIAVTVSKVRGGLVSYEKTRAPKPLTLNPWSGGARHTDSLEYLERGHKTLLEASPLLQVHCKED